MKKACIYDVDSLPGGEVGIEKHISEEGYTLNRGIVCDKNGVVRGKIISGTYFSNSSLELHVLDDPLLERLIDNYQARGPSSGQAPRLPS